MALRALREAVAEVIAEDPRDNMPLTVWRNCKAVWIDPFELNVIEHMPEETTDHPKAEGSSTSISGLQLSEGAANERKDVTLSIFSVLNSRIGYPPVPFLDTLRLHMQVSAKAVVHSVLGHDCLVSRPVQLRRGSGPELIHK